MKSSPYAISTLSLVRRATAFFAFLGFLTLSACSGEESKALKNLDRQAEVYREMIKVLNGLSEGGDSQTGAATIAKKMEQLKGLKREMLSFEKPDEEASEKIASHQEFADATADFIQASIKYQGSGKATPEVLQALNSLHDSAPAPGEGSSQ